MTNDKTLSEERDKLVSTYFFINEATAICINHLEQLLTDPILILLTTFVQSMLK